MKSQRGGEILFFEDYIYNYDKEVELETRWRCQNRSCPGFITINVFDLITDWMFHTHANVKTKIEYLRFKEIIKEKAFGTTERANDIAIREISKIDNDELIGYMPNLSTICDSIKRQRNTKDGLVPVS